MSQKSLEIFPELIFPLDSIASKEIIGSAGFIQSADSIASKAFIDSGDDIDSEEIIASAGSIKSAGSIDSANFIDSGDDIDLANLSASEEIIGSAGSIDSTNFIDSGDDEDFIDSGAFIGSEDFIDSGYSLDSEISLESEDSFTSANPILFQEIEVDSLTGVPTDSTAYGRGPRPRTTTALRDSQLAIRKFSYNNLAEVTATVRVELSPFVKFFIKEDLVDITLQASVWGIDRRRNSHLFNFSDQLITGEGTYTFHTFVNSNKLDEDTGFFQDGPTDEIATQFRLTSSDPALVGVNLTAWTNTVTGRY